MRVIRIIGLSIVSLTWSMRVAEAGSYQNTQTQPGGGNRSARVQDEFRWRGQIASGQAIEIKGVNGGVHAEPASGNEVEVIATKRGRRSDPNEVDIKVLEHAGGVTICAVYPSDDPSQPNECQPGKGGRMNVRNNDVEVDFTVHVPSGVRLVGRTVNGGIEAKSLKADTEASTVNGSVRLSTSGYAQAQTVNGSIIASLGNPTWSHALHFKTVNGSITLDLPAGTSTEFEAKTVNGDISTDFPLTIQGRFSPRRITGTIGSGGRKLLLETVNGSIKLRQAP